LLLYLVLFLCGKVRDLSASSLLSSCLLVCWFFFNFATSFDFGCCSLAQEMSFVDHYMPYFRQWLITCPPLALLSWYTERSHGDQLVAPPPFSSALIAPHSLYSCSFSVPCLLFSFFGGVVVSLPRGLWWFIPGVAVGILHATYLLTCWSAASKKVWSCFWPLVTILGPPQVTLNTLNQFSQMLV
jgi:hypothetical protein